MSVFTFILVLAASCSGCQTTKPPGALLCVETISRHFSEGQPLVISMPAAANNRTTRHGLSAGIEFRFMDELSENIHKKINWPVLTSRPDSAMQETSIIYKHQSYVILLWAEKRDYLLNSLGYQLENINGYGHSFNRWGKFLVVVTHFSVQSPKALAMDIVKILWNDYHIANSLIMISNAFVSARSFDLYTWLPYESGHCGKVEEVILQARCVFEKDTPISTDTSLLSSKTPLNFHGCPITVFTWDRHPNMILANNSQPNGSKIYEYSGIEAIYLLLLSEQMNMTIKFLPPPKKEMFLSDFFFSSLISVSSGEADIAMGHFPLHYLPLEYCEPTISYLYGTYKWYVPCARPIRRIDNLINLFTAPAWSVIVVIPILSAVTFWCIAKNTHSSKTKESITYRYLSQCFSNVWAVSLGISVAEMPKNLRLRMFFFIFVCYCFAISTVFQTCFTSFLIDPKFSKQIHTFEELKTSDILYLSHPSIEEIGVYMNYDKYKIFMRHHEKCVKYKECLSRLLEGEKAAMLNVDIWAEYAASSSGTTHAALCAIGEAEFTMGLTMYLSKGSLFRDRFNVLIQRCLEAGLGKKYWSELTWKESLKTFKNYGSGGAASGSNVYFALTLFHLRVAFCLLAFGHALSFVVFIAEHLSKQNFTRLRLL